MECDQFDLLIDRLAYGGSGVGRRKDGKVVFVPYVLPGETVKVKVLREHKRHIEADLLELLVASPERVVPDCPHFGVCGGCDWQHIPYSRQLDYKQMILLSEIERVVGCTPETVYDPGCSPVPFGYRGQARFQCSEDGEIGFHSKRSNRVVDLEDCPVMNQSIRHTMAALRKTKLGNLASIEIQAPEHDVLVQLQSHAPINDLTLLNKIYNDLEIAGMAVRSDQKGQGEYVFGQKVGRYDLSCDGRQLSVASGFGSFIQSNLAVNRSMVEHVVELVGRVERVLDLYSGCGNFSLPLGCIADEVVAVEVNRRQSRQGLKNAKRNGLKNVRSIAMDAPKAVRSIVREELAFECAVIDPPREGAKDIVPHLKDCGVRRLVYVSCNPTTLARDLKVLVDQGYRLKSLRLFDMFPQTYHIESVSYLEYDSE